MWVKISKLGRAGVRKARELHTCCEKQDWGVSSCSRLSLLSNWEQRRVTLSVRATTKPPPGSLRVGMKGFTKNRAIQRLPPHVWTSSVYQSILGIIIMRSNDSICASDRASKNGSNRSALYLLNSRTGKQSARSLRSGSCHQITIYPLIH